WGKWSRGKLERPEYRIIKLTATRDVRLKLRREAPFGPQETLRFLHDLADREEAGTLSEREVEQVRGVALDVLLQALESLPGPDRGEVLAPLERLWQRHNGESLRQHAAQLLAALDEPISAELRTCLLQILLPQADSNGCLTDASGLRL